MALHSSSQLDITYWDCDNLKSPRTVLQSLHSLIVQVFGQDIVSLVRVHMQSSAAWRSLREARMRLLLRVEHILLA